MCLLVNYKKKNLKNKISFCILKVTEERSRIRIRTKMLRIPNTDENNSWFQRIFHNISLLSFIYRYSIYVIWYTTGYGTCVHYTGWNTAAGFGVPWGAHRQRQLPATLQQGLPCLRPTRPTSRHPILRWSTYVILKCHLQCCGSGSCFWASRILIH